MVILSYLFVSNIQRKDLLKGTEDAIAYTEANIKSDLLEPETLLGGLAETIRVMIIQGSTFEDVREYIRNIAKYLTDGDQNMPYATAAYGVFDAFGGKFASGIDWVPPDDYVPQSRPWYRAAAEADGKTGVTEPYLDVTFGIAALTFARRIFDDDGNPLGVVCLDIMLDRIRQYAVDTQFAEDGYGFLLSKDLTVIAHPNLSMVGSSLYDLKSGIAVFSDELKQSGGISERIVTDYRGIRSIVSIQKMYNGWYMGIVTPKDSYYETTRNLAIILTALGMVLAVILSIILLRIFIEKQKADNLTQTMFDATITQAEEVNNSKKTITILEKILNGMDAIILVTVPRTGEILFINDRMKTQYNIKNDCVGQFCYKVLHEGKNEKCDFCPCFQLEKDPEKVVVWDEHDTATNRVYHNTDRFIEWFDGKMVHLQHSVDITELNDAKEQAIMASKAKGNFLAKVSHEIRTPMNAILGITEIQLQDENLLPDMQEALGNIYDSGYLLLGIINDILDLSKVEAGKLELLPVKYDVASLINDTVHLNDMRFGNKLVEFELKVDENIPSMLFGDELRIKQILNNILSNAFKYTDRGKVSLSVAAEFALPGEAAQIVLVFCVSDTGQGMTKEQVDNLFSTDYVRYNPEMNREIVGTGLGMNITKQLVTLMGGEIIVESEPLNGSVFTIRLPQGDLGAVAIGSELADNLRKFQLGKSARIIKAKQVVREYMPYGRILIVDDVGTNLYVARGLLSPYGLSIETATSGFEAIDNINGGASYDIIFMDHFMPDMDGVEATKIIRRMGYTGAIVALTANALAGQEEMFLENGFDDFVSKPIDIRTLNIVLNRFIRDKYPPEVVENARQLRKRTSSEAPGTPVDPQLADVFLRDAEKALTTLESIQANCFRKSEDVKVFITYAHAMKSALANIGEAGLSRFASRLEQAGREENMAVMTGETSAFLNELRRVIGKISQNKDNKADETVEEDREYLHEKLAVIQGACSAYDKKAAKDALALLRQKQWKHMTKELLDTIAEHLLHSDFEEIVNAVGDYKNTVNSL
jgi:signal transduction histidine kinase/CheY-like chemotaxis protein